jgi:hypothetical protein
VLVFNEGDCPKFDAGDTAFVSERMLVVPMRAKFRGWRSALADVLLEHYDDAAPPRSREMMEWKADIATAENPYTARLDDMVRVTGDKEDVVLFSDLKNMLGAGADFKRFAKAYFAGKEGVTYKDITKVKEAGEWVSKRGVILGVCVI